MSLGLAVAFSASGDSFSVPQFRRNPVRHRRKRYAVLRLLLLDGHESSLTVAAPLHGTHSVSGPFTVRLPLLRCDAFGLVLRS